MEIPVIEKSKERLEIEKFLERQGKFLGKPLAVLDTADLSQKNEFNARMGKLEKAFDLPEVFRLKMETQIFWDYLVSKYNLSAEDIGPAILQLVDCHIYKVEELK